MIDIIHAFQQEFDEQVLIAGLVNPRNHPLDKQVRVESVITYDRSSTLRRLWTWIAGFVQILYLAKWKYRQAHLFLVSNPPLATLLPLFCRNTYSLLIYDVYPDTLTEYNIFSPQNFFVRWWKKANRKIYRNAHRIFTLSEGMQALMSQYVAPEQITIVPVWTDNTFLKPISKQENPFLREQGLTDKFLVMYSGNLGKSHELQVLIALAEKLNDKNIFVLIIGGGDQYKSLESMISTRKLDNIRLLPWQPTELLPYTLAAADLGVVSLGSEASLLSMPSKTFNLMSVGCPIMAIVDPQAALAKLVAQHGIGQDFEASAIEEMADFIVSLSENKAHHQQLSEQSLATSRKFGPENALKFVEIYQTNNV